MAKFEFEGINEYAAKLSALEKDSETMIKRAVYDGADVVANAVKSAIQALPADTHNPKKGEPLTLLTYEKEGLIQGLGLSKMKNENGFINTKLGFSGYNRLKSKKYPNGHPNALIARSIEKGSTVRRKKPFINKAAKAASAQAEAAMAARFDADTQEIIK